MVVLELIFGILISFVICSLIFCLIQNLKMQINYSKLEKNHRVFCDFETFKKFNKYFCDLYNLCVEDYEVIYFYKLGSIIRINQDYFKFDGANLIYLFNSKNKLENRLDIEINKIDDKSEGKQENE